MDIGRPAPASVSRSILDDLIAQKALFEALASAVPDGLIHVDARGNIARFNAAAVRLTGIAAENAIGRPLHELLADSSADPLRESDGAPVALQFRGNTGGHCIRARVCPVPVGLGYLLLFGTPQRFAELEQLKRELVSTVSHELKTPLAAIKAYAATLRNNPALYDAERDEYLGIIESQADRLAHLIEELLLVGRVESGQLIRRRILSPIDRLLDDALAEIVYDPARYPIVRENTAIDVSGDPERLRDLLRNLIENAIKYSPDGGTIRISARHDTGLCVIEITDHGAGIDAADLPYIFDRFFRSEEAAASGAGGSGLGLYIVQALVRAHGGSIDVRSDHGLGTTFVLRLPLR